MSDNNFGPEMKSLSSAGKIGTVKFFERVVSSQNGPKRIVLSEQKIETAIGKLLKKSILMELVAEYKAGLRAPNNFSEANEIALRQKLFPIIDEEMRELDPTYSIFSVGMLELLFEEVEKRD